MTKSHTDMPFLQVAIKHLYDHKDQLPKLIDMSQNDILNAWATASEIYAKYYFQAKRELTMMNRKNYDRVLEAADTLVASKVSYELACSILVELFIFIENYEEEFNEVPV